MVQSICLTSRGSGVRIPQLPPKASKKFGAFFMLNSPRRKRIKDYYSSVLQNCLGVLNILVGIIIMLFKVGDFSNRSRR